MLRHRQIAAAPERQASATWDVITKLVCDTLERSPDIGRSDVEAAMAAAAPAGVMLIAAGHLDRHAVVIVAPPLHLSITTVSGTAASTVEENLGPVPGGASADDWVIHLPTPDPLGDVVRSVAKGSARLSTEPPPDDAAKSDSQVEGDLIDLEALAKRGPEG
jgi:hypothetical protein